MKNIKLKIVTWIIALLYVVGPCIAQDNANLDISPWGDSINFEIEVGITPKPLVVTVESEPIKNNELLQTMLQSETEQTTALNENLLTINETIEDLPHLKIEAIQEMLDLYKVYPNQINKMHQAIYIIWYWILILYLIGWIFFFNFRKKLYWSSNHRQKHILFLIIGSFIIGYIMPKLSCLTLIDNYHLWSNIDKLF